MGQGMRRNRRAGKRRNIAVVRTMEDTRARRALRSNVGKPRYAGMD
jgi:hypothetical protein